MNARQAARAFERMLALTTPEDLWALDDSVRADVFEALAHVAATTGPWRAALVAVADRRGVTTAYVVDRALALRAAIVARDEPDLYAVLGVSPDATLEAIRRRWRVLARRHHPDGGGGPHGEPFLRVRAAYAVLGNPVERLRYDARCLRHRPALPFPHTVAAPRRTVAGPLRMVPGVAAVVLVVAIAGSFLPRRAIVPSGGRPPAPAIVWKETPVEPAPKMTRPPRRSPRPALVVAAKAPAAPAAPSAPPVPEVATVPAPAEPPPVVVAVAPTAPTSRKAIDTAAAEGFLTEFRRRYEAGEALGLLQLFASNGAANGRRGVEIAQAYAEFFRSLRPHYTTGRVRVRPTRAGAVVESELVLTTQGRPPMRGVAYWELVREGGVVRLARLVSSVPAL